MTFNSKILILPGLGNSGEYHWQTLWENQYGFERVVQDNWETPSCEEWIAQIDRVIQSHNSDNVILVGHSLACSTIVFWANRYGRKVKGALLVAPSDTVAPSYPLGTTGFTPMPEFKLPFPSIVITSSDDFYVSLERAKHFATVWGSDFINIGPAGHINASSGIGDWPQGIAYLKRLDQSIIL
ncbi:RBBP9/YdeN family alpha/beta hydrolase [Pseudochryseolinea flava]|uniref:Alpha/beta hydrolase n=1 Tax=Pseudochryseolinea flava TaxID=2059302 RepID=A0A364XZC3_9BACT|nr:alpha/beta hydrolase [Pseudochryseolinea flava]RAV99718.1 alpha/beta hydrolase [Pseudochryseolinea flava]